jgi:hypothetical protein
LITALHKQSKSVGIIISIIIISVKITFKWFEVIRWIDSVNWNESGESIHLTESYFVSLHSADRLASVTRRAVFHRFPKRSFTVIQRCSRWSILFLCFETWSVSYGNVGMTYCGEWLVEGSCSECTTCLPTCIQYSTDTSDGNNRMI